MEERTREIAGIAPSVAGHCQPCSKHHLGRAQQPELSKGDIQWRMRLAQSISGKGDERAQEPADPLMHGEEKAQPEKTG